MLETETLQSNLLPRTNIKVEGTKLKRETMLKDLLLKMQETFLILRLLKMIELRSKRNQEEVMIVMKKDQLPEEEVDKDLVEEEEVVQQLVLEIKMQELQDLIKKATNLSMILDPREEEILDEVESMKDLIREMELEELEEEVEEKETIKLILILMKLQLIMLKSRRKKKSNNKNQK